MFSDIISVISAKDKYLASLIESIDKMLLVDSFTVILKSRAIGERVVKNIILIEGITGTDEMNQKDKINLLERQDFFRDDVYRSFHTLRVFGNRAIHDELEGVFETSLMVCRVLYRVLSWYVIVYVCCDFVPSSYIEPDIIGRIAESEKRVSDAVNLVLGKAYVWLEAFNMESDARGGADFIFRIVERIAMFY